MIYIKYQGMDFPVDFRMKPEGATEWIDPTTLTDIVVYAVDQANTIVEKFAYPARVDYQELEIIAEKVRLWMNRELTESLANKLIHFQVNYAQEQIGLENDEQHTIILSDQVKIIGVPKAEA